MSADRTEVGAADPVVLVHPDADVLAAAAAARTVTALADAQAARGAAHLVVTGGGTGIAVLAAVRHSPAAGAVDWAAVDVWWGDERFLPTGHPDRNETQAREALLDHLPFDPRRLHPMPASDGPAGDDPDAAARAHAAELAAAAGPGARLAAPVFDVLQLGVGPDGHVASLFPDHPGHDEAVATVIGVRDSPKPPPTRISLTMPVLRHARQVWLVAAGEGKGDAAATALAGGPLPAAGPRGTDATLWLVDRALADAAGVER